MTRNLRSNSTVPSNWNLPAHQAEPNQFVTASTTATIAMAVAAPAPAATGAGTTVAAEVWKTTPYSGDFNPGTNHGNTIFVEKTKGLPEANRLDLTEKNSQAIHKYFRAREMLMGDIIHKVPIEYNPDGTVKTNRNLISQYQQITLDDCQQAAIARYDTALAVGTQIADPPFNMKVLDPGADDADK